MPRRRCTTGFILLLLATLVSDLAAGSWHRPLYLDGGRWWAKRIAVRVLNDGDTDLAGFPVELIVGPDSGQLQLEGEPVELLRVCTDGGAEVLFAAYDPNGGLIEQGPLPAGSRLVIPAECSRQSTAQYYVYFDNPSAGCVPDFFPTRAHVVNGDVELGADDTPSGWTHDPPDSQHRATWSTEEPQSGRRCLKTQVADGAESTWIATRQSGIAVVGGAKYRMRAWVRGENVRGFAGWYLHVGDAQQPMIAAPMLSAGDGTFGWKQVETEFTVPAAANRASLGTVLRGTGIAWFDSVTLQRLSPGKIRTEVSRTESIRLQVVGADAPWHPAPLNDGHAGRFRARVNVLNLRDAPQEHVLTAVDLWRLVARTRGRLQVDSLVVTFNGEIVPHQLLGDQLLFATHVPSHSACCYYVYFTGKKAVPSHPARQHSDLPNLPANLVQNPSFERGGDTPDGWTKSGSSPSQGIVFALDTPGRAGQGNRCAKMHVPLGASEAWRGWQQNVTVRPGRTYLLSAWLKCQDVQQGDVLLHAHRRQTDGSLSADQPMTSVGPSITGSTDWTLLSGQLTMPNDTVNLQLHLTMQHSGTLWHDDVAVVEVIPGTVARIEGKPSQSPEELAVWQVPAVVKVFRDDPAVNQPSPVQISAARNEAEPLQLAIRSARDMPNVQISLDPLVGPQGFCLPDIRVEIVGYVPIDHRSSYYQTDLPSWYRKIPSGRGRGDGWSGMWPDPLLPRDTFDLKQNETQPIWITVRVPKDAPEGDYQGRLRLVSAGRELAELPFWVHVWDFALPDESHVAAIYDVRLGHGSHLWGKSLDEMYPEIIRMMASRRLCPDTIRPTPVFRRDGGRIVADFTAFDRAAEVYFDELKFPFAYTPWDFYLFGWGHPPKAVFGQRPFAGDSPYESADRTQLRAEYRQIYQKMLRLFWDHLKEKGWERRVVLYISDEPFDQHEHIRQQMQALCDMIHEVDSEIPIYSSTWKHVPDWDGYLDVWGIGHYGRVAPQKMDQLRAAGDRIWFTTDGQMCTDTPYAAVERLLPHYCFKYGAEAYEFWGVAWLTYDPLRFGWHSFIHQSSEPGKSYWVRYPNGDGFLLYPGNLVGHDGLISSLRFEQAREGVEDYEYLYLLRQLIGKAKAAGEDVVAAEQALDAARDLVEIPNAGGYYSTKILPDPDRLYVVRRNLAAAIESLVR